MKFLHRFQKQSQEPKTYSLIDVGRDTVKAVVVLMKPESGGLQIIGYGRSETGGHDITGGRIKAGVVTHPVNTALIQAEDSTERFFGQKVVPDDVIFALAGRATAGKLFTVKQNRPKPKEPVSEKELTQLRIRVERLVKQGLATTTTDGGQWQPLAVTDAGLRLDNHLVLDGLGLTGQELSFSVFGVAGQAGALRALEVLANRLDLTLTNIVATPHALASLAPHTESIILDIGFSGTDICLIRNNALVAAAWVPFGGYFFRHGLAQAMNIEPAAARELIHAFAGGQLASREVAKIETFLMLLRQRWYEAVMEVLAEFSYDTRLPRRIYLTGGGSLLPGFDKLLRANPASFDSAPEVSRLLGQSLPGIKDVTEALDYNLFALTISLIVGLPE
jgi:cell division ATPase FtsA